MQLEAKRRILILCFVIGVIAVMAVLLKAHAAEVMCENNKIIKENAILESEVDTLDIKIKAANNVEHVEKVARKKLGMKNSDEETCIYLTDRDSPKGDLAMTIIRNAYN